MQVVYANKPKPKFSNMHGFQVLSKRNPIIKCTYLEMYLSEAKHKIMKIDEQLCD